MKKVSITALRAMPKGTTFTLNAPGLKPRTVGIKDKHAGSWSMALLRPFLRGIAWSMVQELDEQGKVEAYVVELKRVYNIDEVIVSGEDALYAVQKNKAVYDIVSATDVVDHLWPSGVTIYAVV